MANVAKVISDLTRYRNPPFVLAINLRARYSRALIKHESSFVVS